MSQLGDMFTESFSSHELHFVSILDVLAIVKEKSSQEVGHAQHASGLSKDNQLLCHDKLPIKGINSKGSEKREMAKYLKLSRCS